MHDETTENWAGWDDPLTEVANFLQGSPPRAVAEQLYRLVLRDVVTEHMLENGLNPLDRELSRSIFASEVSYFTQTAHQRLLQICASIASREG